ncbi:MAG: hypothetical protein HAW66_09780 [Shewanella sp.]|nr:hypothetical protein [Shewanella sp.]
MRVKISKRIIKDKIFGKTSDTAMGVQVQEMADARLGAMYFLGNINTEKVPSFSLNLFGTFVAGTAPINDLKKGCMYILNNTGAGQSFLSAASSVGDTIKDNFKKSHIGIAVTAGIGKVSEGVDKIKALIVGFFQKMLAKIKLTYGDALHGMEWLTEFGTWLVSVFAGNLASLIPGFGYVRSASALYGGVKSSVLKSIDFIEQLWSGHGVELLGGHPSIIANALARHSAIGVASALKGVAIHTTRLGLTIAADAAGGAGIIVNAVAGILTRITSFADYIIQRVRLSKVLSQAKKEWINHSSPTSMVNNHKAFSEWFQNAVITTPIIAALAVGSGFVAHPYRFAQLLSTSEEPISHSEFAKSVKHIETLKKVASGYFTGYKGSYGINFVSDDPVIKARLQQLAANKSKSVADQE